MEFEELEGKKKRSDDRSIEFSFVRNLVLLRSLAATPQFYSASPSVLGIVKGLLAPSKGRNRKIFSPLLATRPNTIEHWRARSLASGELSNLSFSTPTSLSHTLSILPGSPLRRQAHRLRGVRGPGPPRRGPRLRASRGEEERGRRRRVFFFVFSAVALQEAAPRERDAARGRDQRRR